MTPISELLQIAQRAAIEAGQEIMKIYTTDFAIEFKADNSPLTMADKAANSIIMKYLEPLKIPIISEENKDIPYEARKDWRRLWMIDPLDGTKEFVKRNGEFTVNIAFIENGLPECGVIYAPDKKLLYIGSELGGFKFENIGNVSDLKNADRIKLIPKKPTSKIMVVASRTHINRETEDFVSQIVSNHKMKNVNTISAGSSLKLCMVAEGLADVYPRFAPTMEWDVAAGHAICKSAGIKVLQANTQNELKYNKPSLLNPWFVVGDKFGSYYNAK